MPLSVGCAGVLVRVDWLRPIAAAGFCVALVLVPFAGRVWVARASPLTKLAADNASVTLELVTTGDPRTLAAHGVAGAPRVAVPADVERLDETSTSFPLDGEVVVLAPATQWRDVLPGQPVRVIGKLAPSLDGAWQGATLFADKPPVFLGTPPWWQRAAGVVRAGLRDAAGVLPYEERGLLPGLVDGDTTGLDPVLIERFRVAGLTHLVAVSGTNCSIVIGAVLLVLRRARVRPWVCAAVGAAVLVAFVVVARPSPSVLRAAVMASIALVCLATGRPRAGVPMLAASVLGLLIWDPTLAGDAGFAMSVLATAALLLLAPGWASALRRRRVPAGVAEAFAVATAAHLVTAPVIAALSGRVSLVAVPANVLAEPAVPVATVFGFGAAVIAPIWASGARGLAWVAGWPCRWLVGVADRLGSVPGARLPWLGGLVGALTLLAATLALVALVARGGVGRLIAVAVLLIVLVQIPVRSVLSGWPPPDWDFIACDVGQGDALVLPAAPHVGVEIDAGPDPVLVDRCLSDLGITEIALLVFTHYHLDHVGGLAGVLHDRTVDRVVTGPLAEPASGVQTGRRAAGDPAPDDLDAGGRNSLHDRAGAAAGAGAAGRLPRHPLRPEQLLTRHAGGRPRSVDPAHRRRRGRGAAGDARGGRRRPCRRAEGAAPRLGVLRPCVPRGRACQGRGDLGRPAQRLRSPESAACSPSWPGSQSRCDAQTTTVTSPWSEPAIT